MSVNQQITKGWIQYLKNNQIAALQSNPKTGRLNYIREPTVTDLVSYLSKDFDEDEILDAVQQAKSASQSTKDNPATSIGGELATQGSRDPSTWHNSEVTPGQPWPELGNNPTPQLGNRTKKYNTDDAEDAKYSQRGVVPHTGKRTPSTWHNSEVTPADPYDQIGNDHTAQPKKKKYNTDDADDAEIKDKNSKSLSGPKRKPKFKYRYKPGQLKEAIRDWQGDPLSEKEIQTIFKILSQPNSKKVPSTNVNNPSTPVASTGNAPADLEDQIRKIKAVIRDTMSDQQRKSLYRALTDV